MSGSSDLQNAGRGRGGGDLLVGPGWVATPRGLISDAGVSIRAGRIAAVGPFDTLRRATAEVEVGSVPQRPTTRRAAATLDAGGGLILPGFINAHTHLYSAFACGMPVRESPRNFSETLERIWWRLDRALTDEDVRLSALVGLRDCVRCGVTTVVDHHASPSACAGSLDLIREAADTVGLRVACCYEVSDRDGAASAAAGIAENRRFIRALRSAPSERSAALFGLHALFTLSEETLAQAVATAQEEGVGLHLHLAEDRVDVERNLDAYGERPLARLARHGGLDARAVLAHGVHLEEAEMTDLAASGARLVHNPESNMNNAVGRAPIEALRAAGVRIALGTDGLGTDMLAAARAAFLQRRHSGGEPQAAWDLVPELLWRANAELATGLFGLPLGRLTPGAAGDLVVLEYDPPTPMSNANLIAHLLFGMRARHLAATVVAGHVLMRARRLCTIDDPHLTARARESARRLWTRL